MIISVWGLVALGITAIALAYISKDLHNKMKQAKIDYANACIVFNEIQRIKRPKLKVLIIAQNNELKGGE